MGICTVNKVYRISSSTHTIDPLLHFRLEMLDYVKTIHQLSVKCIQGIETCILNHQEDKAIIIKAKQIFLKKTSTFLQDSIKKIDNAMESNKNSDNKLRLIEEIKRDWLNINKDLFKDDTDEIIQLSTEDDYIVNLEKMLQTRNTEKRCEIVKELQGQIHRIKKLNEDSSNERRSYSRHNK